MKFGPWSWPSRGLNRENWKSNKTRIKNLKDLIECIVVLVQVHECLVTHKKWAKYIFQVRSSRSPLQRLPLKNLAISLIVKSNCVTVDLSAQAMLGICKNVILLQVLHNKTVNDMLKDFTGHTTKRDGFVMNCIWFLPFFKDGADISFVPLIGYRTSVHWFLTNVCQNRSYDRSILPQEPWWYTIRPTGFVRVEIS